MELNKHLAAIADPISFLKGFFAYSPLAFQIFDPSGQSIVVNQAFIDLFGDAPEANYNIVKDKSAQANGATTGFHEALTGKKVTIPSLWFETKALGMDCEAFPILCEKGNVCYVGFMYRDVTQELLTSKRLAVSESRVDRLMDSELLGLFRVDMNGRIRDANSEFLKISGFSAMEVASGKVNWNTGVPLEYWDVNKRGMDELRSTGICPVFEKEFLRKDGTRIPVMVGGTVLSSEEDVLCFALDMTELKKLEQQLRQAQKMEAIGQLAGGIAHDFNNILSLIVLNVEFLMEDSKDESLHECIRNIGGAAEKATRLTKQLLAFSRNQVMDTKVLDTKVMLKDMKQLFQSLLTATIHLDMDLSSEIPNVRTDQTHMEQILMNLAFNARDAMPTGGTLTIKAEAVDGIGSRSGKFLHVSVKDTGVGMEKKTLDLIFEPFFTTKEPGKGTGLGLPTVFGIVKQAGGEIRVESELGAGTTFHIYIPACDDEAREEVVFAPLISQADGRTVMLVEDEEDLRKITATFLRRKGFNVLEASNGDEARQAIQKDPSRVNLIVTDVIMPEKSGPAFIEELKSDGVDAKVLFLSGYSSDELISHGISLESSTFLSKPFTTRDLLSKIEEMMVRN